MLRPRALRSGDKVAVVSPASPFVRDEFEAGIEELHRLGFHPVYDESVFAREPMVSGAPAVRAAAFLKALRDPDVRAIIAVRGGYGSVELLPFIDAAELRAARKIICGYSDITSLLIHATCHAGLVSFHGPMIDRRLSRGAGGYHRASMLAAMQTAAPMGDLRAEGVTVLKAGRARGMLIGGTLTQITAGLGTPYGIKLDRPSILFIEDVNERPYKLRRMLTQLKFAGVLQQAAGIVFGAMADCDEPGVQACDVISAFFADFDGPVLSGFPSGHGAAPVWTLPFGVEASVSTADGGILRIEEPAVED